MLEEEIEMVSEFQRLACNVLHCFAIVVLITKVDHFFKSVIAFYGSIWVDNL